MSKLRMPVFLVIFVFALLLALNGCGANSPAGSSVTANNPAPNLPPLATKTGVSLSVNFPLRNTPAAGLNGLLSANTTIVDINVYDGAYVRLIGSGSVTAPIAGGPASSTVLLNVSNTYTGPISIQVVSYGNASRSRWLGDVRLTGKTLAPLANNPFQVTMVQNDGQGFLIASTASSPVVVAPDGSKYQITKVFFLPYGLSQYNMCVESYVKPSNPLVAPYIGVNYASTFSINSAWTNNWIAGAGLGAWWVQPYGNVQGAVEDSTAYSLVQFNSPQTVSGNLYAFSLNFSDMTNNPSLSIVTAANTASASVANPLVRQAWTNGITPSQASTGVSVVVN